MEAGIHLTAWQAAIFFATDTSPGPEDSAHVLAAPYQAFPTADGWINIGCAGIPAGPIQTISQVAADPQTLAREIVVKLDPPVAGRTQAMGGIAVSVASRPH